MTIHSTLPNRKSRPPRASFARKMARAEFGNAYVDPRAADFHDRTPAPWQSVGSVAARILADIEAWRKEREVA